jgi:hypothetical protein
VAARTFLSAACDWGTVFSVHGRTNRQTKPIEMADTFDEWDENRIIIDVDSHSISSFDKRTNMPQPSMKNATIRIEQDSKAMSQTVLVNVQHIAYDSASFLCPCPCFRFLSKLPLKTLPRSHTYKRIVTMHFSPFKWPMH